MCKVWPSESPLLEFEEDWSSPESELKRYFKREVLIHIEKGMRKVGMEEGRGCPNCYSYGEICQFHKETAEVSWADMVRWQDCWVLVVFRGVDYFDYSRISSDMFVAAHRNWVERQARFSYAQWYAVE